MALELARIKALCFDVDGTISDTDDLWMQKIERILHPFRRLLPNGNITSFARWLTMSLESPGNAVYHMLDRIGLDDEVAAVVSWIAQHNLGHRPKQYLIIPGVKEMLSQLSRYYPISVVSARDEKSTIAFLEYFDLLPYLSDITTAHTCKYTKPFPDPLIWSAGQLGVKPEECLMIGDTTVDIHAGSAAGTQTVGVLCGFGERAELVQAGADMIIDNTADLTDFLIPN